MTSEIIQPEGWPSPRGYSNAIASTGRVIALAGQVGWNPQTLEFESDDFVQQVLAALSNVVVVLRAANAAPENVVRLVWYITDRDAYISSARQIGEVYRSVFGPHYPAMSVVVVSALVEAKAKVEIEATAVI
jgi:enamine deaminase RidA (YjgF/YER057c/UK114 family)